MAKFFFFLWKVYVLRFDIHHTLTKKVLCFFALGGKETVFESNRLYQILTKKIHLCEGLFRDVTTHKIFFDNAATEKKVKFKKIIERLKAHRLRINTTLGWCNTNWIFFFFVRSQRLSWLLNDWVGYFQILFLYHVI